jgi:Ni/Co efflux regulator RcnB
MKTNRIKSAALAAVAALSFAAPMALAAPASAETRYEQNHNRNDHRNDNRNDSRNNHRDWRRGERASVQDRHYWRNVDYRRAHFRAPPRGYHYVRDDRSGQYLLVGLATGVILSVIASH